MNFILVKCSNTWKRRIIPFRKKKKCSSPHPPFWPIVHTCTLTLKITLALTEGNDEIMHDTDLITPKRTPLSNTRESDIWIQCASWQNFLRSCSQAFNKHGTNVYLLYIVIYFYQSLCSSNYDPVKPVSTKICVLSESISIKWGLKLLDQQHLPRSATTRNFGR